MTAYLLLVVCLGLGIICGRWAPMPDNTPAVINAWLLRIAMPALVLAQVPKLHFEADLLVPALAPWGLMAGAALGLPWIAKREGWDRGATGALILTCGLANTSFVGLPMILALRGPDALGPAVIADQFGSFLVLSTAGIVIAAFYAGERASLRDIVLRVVYFPPAWAMVTALLIGQIGSLPAVVDEVLSRLAETLTPLALFSIGLQFRLGHLARSWKLVSTGLAWKLIAAPLLLWITLTIAGIHSPAASIGILQVAMAPMITGGIIAQQYRLAPDLATTVIGIGIVVSFVTVPVFSWLIP